MNFMYMTNTKIQHYNEQSFHWLTWRSGSIIDVLKIPHRTTLIVANKNIIRQHAIGWCKADNIPCRPKLNHVAVMFNTNGVDDWWTHLRIEEFITCFPELKNLFVNTKK